MEDYTIERNGKLWGQYDTRVKALAAWDKAVDYAISPDSVVLKKGDHIYCQYTPLPERRA